MSFYFRLTEVTLCLDEVRNKYSVALYLIILGIWILILQFILCKYDMSILGFSIAWYSTWNSPWGYSFYFVWYFLLWSCFFVGYSFDSKISMLWQMTIELSCSSYVIWNICQHFSNISGLKKTSLRLLM